MLIVQGRKFGDYGSSDALLGCRVKGKRHTVKAIGLLTLVPAPLDLAKRRNISITAVRLSNGYRRLKGRIAADSTGGEAEGFERQEYECRASVEGYRE